MKHISHQRRADIVSLLQHGFSTREIAMKLGISHTSVSNVRRDVLPLAKKPSAGRPRSLTDHQERSILRSISAGNIDTAQEAQRNLKRCQGIEISAQTIRNMLKRRGLKSATKVKKPLLKRQHIKRRLEFARKYSDWTVEDWRRVVFSDEAKVNRFGPDGRKWCWKEPKASFQPNHVTPTIKNGGGSIMVWGCITARGVGNLVKIDGTMNAELYCKILEEDLLGSLEWYGLDRKEIVFQHDNDPKHTAKKTTEWLQNVGMEVLDWPPQSPDLNPIEHLWDYFKRKLSDFPTTPTSIRELWERAEQVWNEIPPEKCLDLIDSMPRRVAAVLKAKGGHTAY